MCLESWHEPERNRNESGESKWDKHAASTRFFKRMCVCVVCLLRTHTNRNMSHFSLSPTLTQALSLSLSLFIKSNVFNICSMHVKKVKQIQKNMVYSIRNREQINFICICSDRRHNINSTIIFHMIHDVFSGCFSLKYETFNSFFLVVYFQFSFIICIYYCNELYAGEEYHAIHKLMKFRKIFLIFKC